MARSIHIGSRRASGTRGPVESDAVAASPSITLLIAGQSPASFAAVTSDHERKAPARSKRWAKRLIALAGVASLLIAAGIAIGQPRARAPYSRTSVVLTSLSDAAEAAPGTLSEIGVPALQIAPVGHQEAAAPAASQALASAAVTDPAPAGVESLSPVEKWLALGVDIVTQGQDWDDQSLANVDQALSALPPGMLASLGNPGLGGMRIAVNRQGRELSGTQPYGGPANFYSTNEGINELVLYPDQSAFTVLHELGHAYNLRRTPAGRYALVLLDPEMQSFMAATGWHVLSTDAQVRSAIDQIAVSYAYDGGFMWSNLSHNDPLEDFANCFAMYFLNPAKLESLSPARYEWLAANIGR